jgi:hypothetical protein
MESSQIFPPEIYILKCEQRCALASVCVPSMCVDCLWTSDNLRQCVTQKRLNTAALDGNQLRTVKHS